MGGKKRGKLPKRSRNDGTYKEKNYVLQPKESKLFEEYYRGQGIVEEGEWGLWMDALLRPLPCTFRVTAFRSHSKELLEIVKRDHINYLVNKEEGSTRSIEDTNNNSTRSIEDSNNNSTRSIEDTNNSTNIGNGDTNEGNKKEKSSDVKSGDEAVVHEAPKCLSWYPGGWAWQLSLDRKMLRVDGRLKQMHQFLMDETESGSISRQEAVSMIPPILLAVKPNHKVLDMCAAPGSKTAQLIEMLHGGGDDDDASGMVVANDSENKRCYLMVHQLNRLLSERYVVVNSDASNMTSFVQEGKLVHFDRVLCDVPCTGDGTLRKNVDAWQRWNPGAAHGLHNLQRRIAKRGVELCEVGGLIVYSTCSFNPVENEAVVVFLLKTFGDALELLEVRDKLPGLKVVPGRTSWKVMTKNSEWFSTSEEVPQRLRTQLHPTLFPPPAEEMQHYNLHKCIRIMPHHQDTGGFFVALLRKKSPATVAEDTPATVAEKTPAAVAKETPATVAKETSIVSKDTKIEHSKVKDEEIAREDVAIETKGDGVAEEEEGVKKRKAEGNGRPAKKSRQFGYKEDPFVFMTPHDPTWKPIIDFYGITDSFHWDQLMVRCEGGKKRNIYYVGEAVKKMVVENEDRFKFINMGVKMFSRSSCKDACCDFRLVQDGIHILYPHLTKRIVQMTRQDIVTLLSTENPFIELFEEETRKELALLKDQGGCIFIYKPQKGRPGPSSELLLSGWRGKVSCRSFLAKADRGHYLRLCGVEVMKVEEHKKDVESKNKDEVHEDNDSDAEKVDEEDDENTKITAND